VKSWIAKVATAVAMLRLIVVLTMDGTARGD